MAKPKTIHTIESLKAKTIDDAGCWIWQGYYQNDVPSVQGPEKMVYVKRYMLDLLGKIYPAKSHIHSSCGHKGCVNPEHFKIYTVKQHMDVLRKKAHQSKTRIAKLQKYRRENTSKINVEIAQEFRTSNESGAELARKYNVSRSLVSRVRRNKTWVDTNHPFLSLMR